MQRILAFLLAAAMLLAMLPWSQPMKARAADTNELALSVGEMVDSITATQHTFRYAGMIDEEHDTQSLCYYTDSYFLKSADSYNASLATMSLCLELSCWPSHEKTDWYDPEITPDSREFWQDRLVNVKKLLLGDPEAEGDTGLGFSNFSANEDWQSPPEKDSIGVCLAQKTIRDRDNQDCTLIAIVIRGGNYGSEWGGNFNVGREGAHEGFADARDEVLRFTKEYIQGLDASYKRNMKLWIVGYSRGGATANMVAGALNNSCRAEIGVDISSDNIYCYTFEAPQGILTSQIAGSDANIHNVLNTNDLVPLVVPSAWGFTRFGCDCETPHYFPSRYTTDPAGFEAAELAMRQQMEEMGFTEEYLASIGSGFSYSVEEFTSVPTVHISWQHFLPKGRPLYWTEETMVPTREVLLKAVDFLATEVFPDRGFYCDSAQECITGILVEVMQDDEDAGKARLEELKGRFSSILSVDNAIYILTPLCRPGIGYTWDERARDAMDRLGEVLKETFRDVEGSEELISAAEVLLGELLLRVGTEVLNNNTDSVNFILQAAKVFSTTGFQPHFPEVTLAWCRSLDPNYNSALTDMVLSTGTRIVRINCPADVRIYDAAGTVVAEMLGDTPSPDNRLIGYVNSQGETVFYLPGNAAYSVDMEVTGNGEANYSIREYDLTDGAVTAARNYYDIPVSEGDILKATVQAIPAHDSAEREYRLEHNGDPLTPDEIITGTRAKESCAVTVRTAGTGGYAEGTGRYAQGGFVRVEATTLPGGQFLGWYDEEGELLSKASVYRFTAREDRVIVAKFTDVDFHELELEAKTGGTIDGLPGYYCPGMEISLTAVPGEGYTFVGWEVSEGSVDNPENPAAVFIMPDEDARVTAVFEPIREEGPSDTGKIILWSSIIPAGALAAVLGILIFRKRK